jgi:hypothetical protein
MVVVVPAVAVPNASIIIYLVVVSGVNHGVVIVSVVGVFEVMTISGLIFTPVPAMIRKR